MDRKISACIINKNEGERLRHMLLSFKDYVDEIVIVDTGSTDDGLSHKIAQEYAHKFEIFTDCNDPETGNITDFSMARNKALSLATHDVVFWADADDEVFNAAGLRELANGIPDQNVQILLPYEYSHDQNGNVNCLHYRERLVYPRNNFKWSGKVHEVLICTENSSNIFSDNVKIIHRRVSSGKQIDPYRNHRILKKVVDELGDSDPRQLYYFGLECGNVGDHQGAIDVLKRYVKVTGWDDEKCLAELKIGEHHIVLDDLQSAIEWGLKAINTKENWAEAYFHLGRTNYLIADKLDKAGLDGSKYWEKCINFCRLGLSLPPTKTVLFVSPAERIDIHRYLNYALNKVNRIHEALESVNEALKAIPGDEALTGNKITFERVIAKHDLAKVLEKLIELNVGEEEILQVVDVYKKKDLKVENNILQDERVEKLNWKAYHRPAGYPRNVQESDFPVAEKTPHSQAWGIPETFVIDDLPMKMTDDQLQAMVVAVWKEYMLHDEVLSAISFLENAPYRVRHSYVTDELMRKSKATIRWITEPDEYNRGNAAEDMNGNLLGTEMVPLPAPLQGQAFVRWKWLTDRMPDMSKEVLDLACIDGEFSNRWGLMGYKVTGVDCCSYSIAIANDAAKRHNTGVNHILSYFDKMPEKINKKFDYITCGDVYEHLLDPVKDLLKPAREMITDEGKMLLVCPAGSWFRGQFCSYAHPWLWANEGETWLADKNRGHVIAPSVWSTIKHFRDAGFYVHNCTQVAQWMQDVPEQGNVCVEAWAKKPGSNTGKDIIFYIGPGMEDWTPDTINLRGNGGSEIAAVEMAKNLVKQGNRVRIYSSCGKLGEGIYEGVEYYDYRKYHDLQCDVLVVSRFAYALENSFNIKAKLKSLWVHDILPKGMSAEVVKNTDIVFALSQWHANTLKEKHPEIANKVIITSNGIDISRFAEDKNTVRNPHAAIVSSSPDRYLPSLLQMWSKIKAQVPDATLTIAYGFDNWKKAYSEDPNHVKLIESLENQIKDMESLGVKHVGRVNPNELARLFKSSGVWTFPTWFSETSCISGMEAQAAGCIPVTSPIAALNETVGDRGKMVYGDWLSKEYQEEFVKQTVNVMLHTTDEDRIKLINYACSNFPWKEVSMQWDNLFKFKLDKPLLPKYIPLIARA